MSKELQELSARDLIGYIPGIVAAISALSIAAAISYQLGVMIPFKGVGFGVFSIGDFLSNSINILPFTMAYCAFLFVTAVGLYPAPQKHEIGVDTESSIIRRVFINFVRFTFSNIFLEYVLNYGFLLLILAVILFLDYWHFYIFFWLGALLLTVFKDLIKIKIRSEVARGIFLTAYIYVCLPMFIGLAMSVITLNDLPPDHIIYASDKTEPYRVNLIALGTNYIVAKNADRRLIYIPTGRVTLIERVVPSRNQPILKFRPFLRWDSGHRERGE